MNFRTSFFLIKISFLIVGVLQTLLAISQNDNKVVQQPQFWTEFNVFDRWSKKWASQVDVQYATQGSPAVLNMFKYQQQFTVRAWAHCYYWNKNERKFRFSGFIGNWDNDEIKDLNIPRINEYRAAFQFNTYSKSENPLIVHRSRIEYRMFEKNAGEISSGFDSALRLRYQTRIYKPLNKSTLDSGAIYLIGFQESFIFLYDQRSRISLYDQNRIFLGLGYVFSPSFTLEVGYFGMFQKYRLENKYEMNHILQVSVFFDNIFSQKIFNKKTNKLSDIHQK